MGDVTALRAKVLGAESRNDHFTDAAAKCSTAGCLRDTHPEGSLHVSPEMSAKPNSPDNINKRPLNGMNDEPDIPRFGADEIDYGY